MEHTPINTDIIIVDDDQFQLKLLSHQLAMVGYEHVTAYDDGKTALDQMKGKMLDSTVIILDLNMPNMDGLEFLEHLRNSQFKGALLLVSGEDARVLQAAEKLAGSYNLQVLGHLSKPVQQETLQKYLNALSKSRKNAAAVPRIQRYSVEQLRHGIEQGQLFNLYQPKVLLSTGELIGVEALVRWNHPQDGIVLPDEFITLAEESEMIDKIARLVLRNALKDSVLWREFGINITVAVNISMYNLNTRDFVNFLESELSASGVSPQDLTLELTESKLMQDYSLVLDMLTRLRLRRVNLSIDDFGTGHSSMAQLRDIPFNELKIDRGFVHTAWDNATLHGIFDGSMQLAKNLGIKTVAEGVEDEADWSFLWNSGCDHAQGYFIGKPMTAAELPQWQEQWTARYLKIAV